jgi:hypothetical protein
MNADKRRCIDTKTALTSDFGMDCQYWVTKTETDKGYRRSSAARFALQAVLSTHRSPLTVHRSWRSSAAENTTNDSRFTAVDLRSSAVN